MFRLRNLDPENRRTIATANAALALGLTLQLFVHPAGSIAKYAFHAVSGLLLGISIATNILGLRRQRQCRAQRP